MKQTIILFLAISLASCNDTGNSGGGTGDSSLVKGSYMTEAKADSSGYFVHFTGRDTILEAQPKVDSFDIKLECLLKRIEYGNNVATHMKLAQAYHDNYAETGDEEWLKKAKKNQRKARYWVRKYDSVSHVLNLPGNQGNLH